MRRGRYRRIPTLLPWARALGLACAQGVVGLVCAPGAAAAPPEAGAASVAQMHTVQAHETVFSIAQRYGLAVPALAAANGLTPPYTLAIGQTLKLPAPAALNEPIARRLYAVKAGDTVYNIAKRYGVNVAELAQLNRLASPYPLTIGQPLLLPGTAALVPAAAPAPAPPTHPTTHVVRRSDTPYNIAKRYGISVAELERANHLTPPYVLYIGAVLTLPPNAVGGAPRIGVAEASGHMRIHTVQSGDTLYNVSRRYGRSVDALKSVNKLSPPYELTIGQLLLIPEEEGMAQPAPTPVPAPVPKEGIPAVPPPPIAQVPPPRKESEAVEAKSRRTGVLSGIEFNLTGAVRTVFSYRTGDVQAADVRAEPSISFSPFDGWTFYAKGRILADAKDKLERGRPNQLTRDPSNRRLLIGDRSELELREAYLKGKAASIDWTIGKQSIVWGEADGLKVLDVVDPQSYKEFILEPYADSRIPRWSVRAERHVGPATLEGVVLFDNTYNEYPPEGSQFDVVSAKLKPVTGLFPQVSLESVNALFATLSPLVPFRFPELPAVVPPITIEAPRRAGAAKEPDFGGRIKTFVHGWDLSVLYYRHTDLDPSLKTILSVRGLELTPEYNRVNLMGATFANAFGNFTVRGEFGFTTDRIVATRPNFLQFARFATMTSEEIVAAIQSGVDLDARAKRGNLSYVLGVDYFGFRNTVVSVQFFQESVLNPPPRLLQPKTSYSGTFYVRRTALNEKLTADLQAIVNFSAGDAVIRPRVKYDFRDNLSAYMSADIFVGSQTGIFGSFKDSSRIVTGIEFSM